MRSERRHELQRNALADWLIRTWEAFKPYVNTILIGVIVVMLAIIGYGWFSRKSASQEERAWNDVFYAISASNASELDRVVQEYPKTNAAEWAAVLAGDLSLQAGCEELFQAKATAADELQNALDKYKLVLETSRESDLRERATYGLARTYEAMAGARRSQGDLALALEHYEKVVDEWPEGTYVEEAARRASALKHRSTKEFYDEFAAWEPKPAFTPPAGIDDVNIPFDGSGLQEGSDPQDFFKSISDRLDQSTSGSTEEQGEAQPEGESPADGAEAPMQLEIPQAMPEPAETPAQSEKPAVEETPAAEEKPAAEEEPAAADSPAPADADP